MMTIRYYDVYKEGKLIDQSITKKGIVAKYKMAMTQVNHSIYHQREVEGYRVFPAGETPESAPTARCYAVKSEDSAESIDAYLKKIRGGIQGNVDMINRLTKNKAIRSAAKRIVELSYKCGFDEGRQDVLNDKEIVKENKELKEEVKGWKRECRELRSKK